MSALKKPVTIETLAQYELRSVLGEGGAGRVFAGINDNGEQVAVKALANATHDKRQRFKNEIAFLSKTKHQNIVPVLDHGLSHDPAIKGPFYVMPLFDGSLRDLMKKGIAADKTVGLFMQILHGVEAAHLKGVQHRDLKPENILYRTPENDLAIADFGIACFTEQELVTLVETGPQQRLANFQYAAPEQRISGAPVGVPADIYALGLILNEIFTGSVPHGTDFRTIATVAQNYRYLDPIVALMIKQNPAERPISVASIKELMTKLGSEARALQKISKMDGTVIKADAIDEPLAIQAPRLQAVNWKDGTLYLSLDRPVTREWINAFCNVRGAS